jgi:uncharacterized protein (TIGR03435 family)
MTSHCGRQPSFLAKLSIAAALLSIPAFAQTAPPPPASPSSAAPAVPILEVATIKLNTSGSGGSHTSFHNGTFLAVNVRLKNLMQYLAFGIPQPLILGGPKWLDSQRFDIEAKMDSTAAAQLRALPLEQRTQLMHVMFQQFLADRFQLKTHWETHQLPVYALVVANPKNGTTLEKAKDPATGLGTSTGTGQLQAVSATLADIAQVLTQEASSELGRVVIDRTGIDGKYDIRLKWTPDNPDINIAPGSNAVPPPPGPSIFTAVEEQLGLKLEPSKGPVRVLIIDSVEMPSEN